jgi:hypothetical protein
MKNLISLSIFFFAFLASGCATQSYLTDRRNDLTDIVTCSIGTGAGAKVRVGPLNLGIPASYSKDKYGLSNGCIGAQEKNLDFWILLFGFQSDNITKARGKGYFIGTISPDGPAFEGGGEQLTQIEAMVGLGGTLRLGVNPGELLDFILGWFCFDIYDDDIWLKNSGY